MMTEESWRAFVAMAEAYQRYRLKYLDMVEKMFPNPQPLNDVWKNVIGIIEEEKTTITTAAGPTGILTRKHQKVNQTKIERILILEHKMHETPAPIPPEPDYVPFRVYDGKLLICKNENGKLLTYSIIITAPVG